MSGTQGAELLREAAKLMRERAEAARRIYPDTFTETLSLIPEDSAQLPHIASWHPAVALAVAELLEKMAPSAERFEKYANERGEGPALFAARMLPGYVETLTLAGEFLGRTP